MRQLCLLALVSLLPLTAMAAPADFKTGPIIEGFGPNAVIPNAATLPDNIKLRHVFDAAKASEEGGLNRTLESAARFINMHGAAGVAADKIDVAVIVHGGAAMDLLRDESFAKRRDGVDNPNAALISALTDHGVRIILCGQTAAYRDIKKDELLPNVELALSAMTAHALLQQGGYTLNPF